MMGETPLSTAAELGELRNGLGSLQSLVQLLGSVNVGSRQLIGAVLDVHAECGSIASSVQSLRRRYLSRGVSAACAEELTAFLESCVTRLDEALSPVSHCRALPVARRLSVERRSAEVASALDGALPLVEALCHSCERDRATWAPTAMLHEPNAPGHVPAVGTVQSVALHVPEAAADLELGCPAAAGRGLVSLALCLAAGLQAPGRPELQIAVFESDEVGLLTSIGPAASGPPRASGKFLLHRKVAPTQSCAEEVARLLSARLQVRSTTRSVHIHWGEVRAPSSTAHGLALVSASERG